MTLMAWAHQPHAQLPSPKQQAAVLRVQNRCQSLALQDLLDRPTVQLGPECCPQRDGGDDSDSSGTRSGVLWAW